MQSTGYFATIYRFGVLICGPKNRVFDIKSGHDFVGIETLSRLSIFRSVIATMLRISHGLGLGTSGKMLTRLIGTTLLCSNTPRGNIIVFVILVGKNIIVEGWCNMIL